MLRDLTSRRSFLLSCFAAASGLVLGGCSGSEQSAPPKAEDDPSVKAKDSMDFYKNKVMKKP